MISIPSFLILSKARLYPDSGDPGLLYVDLFSPAPAHPGTAFRWMPFSETQAYLVGEMRFGLGSGGFGDLSGLPPGVRLLPMPWEPGPVVAWYRDGDRGRPVAQGNTSGFGASNAILNGTAPLKAMVSPVGVAADLACRARLSGVEVRGSGRAEAAQDALTRATLGDRAEWHTTLAEALLGALKALLRGHEVTLEVLVDHTNPFTREELEGLALLEWARRISAWLDPHISLAQPAGHVQLKELPGPPGLSIHWKPGDIVTLRAVKKSIEQGSTV